MPEASTPTSPSAVAGAPRSRAKPIALTAIALGAIIGTVGRELPLLLGAFVYERLDRPECDGEHVLDCLGEGIGEFLLIIVLILAIGAAMAIAGLLLATTGLGLLGKAKEQVVDPTRRDVAGSALVAGGTALGMPALWAIVLITIEAVST